MARSANQKIKLLILKDYLLRNSDEGHPVTIPEIINELARYDIKAERKSLYDDIEALRLYGLDIVQSKGNYFVGSRGFEKKIEELASIYDAQLLERQVYVRNRVKSMNESVYYNVDSISDAINQDKAIRFKYFEFTVTKQRRIRKNGAWYEVSPFALMWDDENYYMLAWDSDSGSMKHYRVDKMLEITALDRVREGKEAFAAVDMSAYSKKIFGMFTGQDRQVKLRFMNHLAGAVIDRFGSDVILIPDDEDHFTVTLELAISPQFYAWTFGFGTDAEILSPEDIRAAASENAKSIYKMYNP